MKKVYILEHNNEVVAVYEDVRDADEALKAFRGETPDYEYHVFEYNVIPHDKPEDTGFYKELYVITTGRNASVTDVTDYDVTDWPSDLANGQLWECHSEEDVDRAMEYFHSTGN